ncbi:alpha/beta fold hydrolase [Pelagovum pacificum]|uniref:Palmitoyl-protein thioesterase ABHD10, mitochondrial n=1 Tax=Pelagovum pacificum TaxID=2588711 RepID=A0A5C5G878_9RHOB|nr:alpha/beta hydrolase [Pelagovum pacificum]QQA41617.1 alpha/beta hydrolase [Pelagovum pacificum]TNY30896.1 alpha/beta hydrolase [Pelagovum pacificum]
MADWLTTPEGRRIAYHLTRGEGVPVAFLGGFRSDMEGTKAVHLEAWAKQQGRPFLRFDYSGHGESEGTFEDGAIGDWASDARAALALLDGPAVLVGSSMGGWISLLISRDSPERVAGLVTIAAAPDFTTNMWDEFDEAARAALMAAGVHYRPSAYGDPYPITRRLIEEGPENFLLDRPLALPMPVRMLQGTADEDVSQHTALKLLDHAEASDIRLTLVKGADHRFSTPECLALIEAAIDEVS